METPQTPGQSAEAGTANLTPPPSAATQTPPPPTPTAPPQPEAETETPAGTETPAAPVADRDEKGRFVSPEERAKAGEAGGWMVHLPPEDREELKREPWKYREMKAKLAAIEAAQVRYAPPAPPAPPVPDAADEYAKRMTSLNGRSDKLTPEEFYREQAQIQRDFTDKIAAEAARKAANSAYDERSKAQQFAYINAQPEAHDAAFMDEVSGAWNRGNGSVSYAQAFDMVKARRSAQNGNGHVQPPKPVVPPPPMGEMRSSAQPPTQPSLTGAQKFAQSPRGRALDAERRR